MTKDEFIERARKVHGDKYDYSNVVYKTNKDKVCIICPIHGEFWQEAKSHLNGRGCKLCGVEKRASEKRKTVDDFIFEAKKIHGDKYDYSQVEYVNNNTPVCIICPKHGKFYQTPKSHLNGNGCPKCYDERRGQARLRNTDKFIELAKTKYGDKYSYSKVNYINSETKVCITCPKHGDFWITPAHFLNGEKCRQCALEESSISQRKDVNEFIENARKIHGDKYDYSNVNYVNCKTKVSIICPEHGEFLMTPNSHLSGQGCPKCGRLQANKKLVGSKERFVERAKKIHGDKYDYSKVNYKNFTTKVCIICPKHGEFWQKPGNHIENAASCPKCIRQVSKWEQEIVDFLTKNDVYIEQSNRKILNGTEIDILLTDYGIGIECDGIYWHCEKFIDKKYHLNKTLLAHINGIRLIHIFEDEWKIKRPILESMFLNMLGKTENKIYARKCEIKEVSGGDRKKFLNENHIQGDAVSSINLGLYYNNELVSLMTFSKPRINISKGEQSEGKYELVRFCSKLNTNVIGGASKLFKYFIEKYKPTEVVSYSDKRWATGGLYEKLGFVHDHDSAPNYYYVLEDKRENRFKYRKDRLIKEGYDPNKSEHEIMLERGIYRIYDCGCKVWVNYC